MKKKNAINTNTKINVSESNFNGETHIGDKNIIQDNSVTYEENISDVQNIESLSLYLTNKFGDEKVGIGGAISLLAGILTIFTSLNSLMPNTEIFS